MSEYPKVYYPPICVINRADYPTLDEYNDMLKACNKHYPYKTKTEGGWTFFQDLSHHWAWLNKPEAEQ